MTERTEQQGIADIATALRIRFPDVAPGTIDTLISAEHARLDGPIRDFVPVLVEHAVRERLRKDGHHPAALAS